jgi:mRNA-degrading endonuclease HigB of HigAB toxin-antitoxin module
VVQIDYRTQSIFIRFIGSHQEYDTIDANTV